MIVAIVYLSPCWFYLVILFSPFIKAFLVSSMVGVDYTAEQREILNPYSKRGLLPEQGLEV